jgi:hypothetical protein
MVDLKLVCSFGELLNIIDLSYVYFSGCHLTWLAVVRHLSHNTCGEQLLMFQPESFLQGLEHVRFGRELFLQISRRLVLTVCSSAFARTFNGNIIIARNTCPD